MPENGHVVEPLSETAERVDDFVRTHRDAVSSSLRAEYRSVLARAVEKLPEGAVEVCDTAKSDLKTCIEAYALALASLCAVHLRAGDFIDAVQAADTALIVLGLPLGASLRTAVDRALQRARELHETKISAALHAVEMCKPPEIGENKRFCRCMVTEGISVSEFKNQYFDQDAPVVLQGAAAKWPAVDLWRKPGFLDRLCGFRMVPVEFSKKGSTAPPREEFVSLQRVLEAMHGVEREGDVAKDQIMYLAQHPIFDYMGELWEHIRTPDYVQVSGETEAKLINVWMGSEQSGTRLHYDSSDNLLVQVVGWKRVVLFPPSETSKLYRQSSDDNFSPVHVDNPSVQLHPKFWEANGCSAVLGPGDALYIPAGHWHWVRAITPSISVNFWF